MRKAIYLTFLLGALAMGGSARAMSLGKGVLGAATNVVKNDRDAKQWMIRQRATLMTKLLDPKHQSAQVKKALANGERVFIDDQNFITLHEGKPTLFQPAAFPGDTARAVSVDQLAPRLTRLAPEISAAVEHHARCLNNKRSFVAKLREIVASKRVMEALEISGTNVRVDDRIHLSHAGLVVSYGNVIGGPREGVATAQKAADYAASQMHASWFTSLSGADLERKLTAALAASERK